MPERPPGPRPQNPSPLEDALRAHGRVPQGRPPGERFRVEDLLPRPVEVFVPRLASSDRARLLIHFHGDPSVVEYAAHVSMENWVAATVALGAGSSVYEAPFLADPTLFPRLLDHIRRRTGHPLPHTTVSAFSAGYGAVRILLQQRPEKLPSLLLLDGLHTGYLPDGRPPAQGGRLDEGPLEPFLAFARKAARGQACFLLTHSAVFPGTFASTTECTDHLLQKLGVQRRPVLRWGPLGMQQLSEARRGGWLVMGFAGNTAPDHVDHLHALFHLLHRVRALENPGSP